MPEGIRLLSAIMFTDLVGYTALMGENEAKAKEVRDRHRKVLQELIPSSQGKILQYYGDGTLSIFSSAIQAVSCAVAIQKELQSETVIPLRIGLHAGDIVYDDEGVYGDSVNVASRIESMSVPGSVLISDKLYDEIKNHPDLPAESLGVFELKNVKRPVEIYAVKANGIVIPKPEEIQGKGSRLMKSIAVLPFVNMSADAENEYFSDGISEEIINALTRVDGLQVTSRTSSFAFKGKLQDIREIGGLLGVTTLLEGSVRRAGDKVRITAQLINVSDGYHYWSEVYDRKLEDIFEVQDEISQKIKDRLVENFRGEEKKPEARKEKLVNAPTENMEAYSLYLKGRFHYNKFNPDSFRKAISYYEEAIKLEPKFSQAYAGNAWCYITLGSFGQMIPKTAYAIAEENAKKAIELDKTSYYGYAAMGMLQLFYYWDWKESEKYFTKSSELSPNASEVFIGFCLLNAIRGNYNEALDYIQRAYRVDPLSLIIINQVADVYVDLREYDKAIEYYRKALEIDKNFRTGINGLAHAMALTGKFDEAIELMETSQKSYNDELKGASEIGVVYAVSGRLDKTRECIEKLKKRELRDKDISLSVDFAVLNAAIGNYDTSFEYLEKAYNERHGSLIFIRAFPSMVDAFSKDPRFGEFLKKMNLAD